MEQSPDRKPLSKTGAPRVLVVDDSQHSADTLSALLRMSGYDVHTRYDGASAVAAAEELRPNIIILDLGMPEINGYEACQQIRQQSWSEGMAIVALTGWGPESDMPNTKACGFNAHVIKPTKAGELKQLLADLLQPAS